MSMFIQSLVAFLKAKYKSSLKYFVEIVDVEKYDTHALTNTIVTK